MSAQNPENAYPSSRPDRIFWVQQRGPSLELNFADVGLTEASATALVAAGNEAEQANAAYEAAKSRAKTLGAVARAKADAMDVRARGVIATVRGFANASGDPSAVFNTAEVAPVQRPTPQGPPPAPATLAATLQSTGAVGLKWKTSGAGAVYEVQRRVDPTDGDPQAWETLTTGGTQPSADPGVPAGTSSVSYRVRANRGGRLSPWSNAATLQFVATPTAASLRLAA